MAALDSIALINAVADLAELLGRTSTIEGFLADLVKVIADNMHAQVCSVYLYDEDQQRLVLRATVGLNPALVSRVRLKSGEGLTGYAFRNDAPVLETDAARNARNKPIPDLGEERYPAFLGVPIKRNNNAIGVLVLQHHSGDAFDDNAVRTLRAIASHLAATLENAAFLYELHEPPKAPSEARSPVAAAVSRVSFTTGLIHGTSASRGVGIGTLEYLEERSPDHSAPAIRSLRQAIEASSQQLHDLQREVDQTLSDVASLIFVSHLLMLSDQSFVGRMIELADGGLEPTAAVRTVVDDFSRRFAALNDQRFQEKVQDIQDLGHRILRNLCNADETHGDYEGQIVATHELFPSELVKLHLQHAEAIVFAGGNTTSHIAILAQSLDLPVVGSADPRLFNIPNGTRIIVDAEDGKIVVEPNPEVLDAYRERIRRWKRLSTGGSPVRRLEGPYRTACGERIYLHANVNLVKDARAAFEIGAEGIGLYRSEFPFLIRNGFPTEDEQVAVYRRVVEAMPGRPVRFRTLDLGGDKLIGVYHGHEDNPFLGFRGIRFLLANRDLLREQLRAMLRAGHDAEIGILFPMVASLEEFLAAKEEVAACIKSLQADRLPHNDRPHLGVMIEVPAAIEIADELARHADFLSVGTNDLIMYLLAADRTNPSVAHLYRSMHPAVVRALKRLMDGVGAEAHKVSVCGASAADPAMAVLLIGLGVRTLSVHAHNVAIVAAAVEKIQLAEAEDTARELLALGSSASIERIAGALRERFGTPE